MLASTVSIGVAVLFMLLSQGGGILVPPPTPHDMNWTVAHNVASLVDTSRKDPYNAADDRKLMVSVFLPVDCNGRRTIQEVHMPDETARLANLQFFDDEKANIFDKLYFESCAEPNGAIDAKTHPLVVLEPGAATSRLAYTQMARHLSACGFVVVTIDHPYDASIVEFTDTASTSAILNNGTVALDPFQPAMWWNETLVKAVNTRVKDILFVLDQFRDHTLLERSFPTFRFQSALDVGWYVVMGHGVGGTAATWLAATDPRVRFSINLSGTTPLFSNDIKNHVIFFGREDYTQDDDSNWKNSWKHFTGRVVEWDLQKAGQLTYTDAPWIMDWMHPVAVNPKGTGSIGSRGANIASCFLEAYLRSELIDDPRERAEITKCMNMFPEMVPYQQHGMRTKRDSAARFPRY